MDNSSNYLIEAQELKDLLSSSDDKLSKIRILDGTFYLPNSKSNAEMDYFKKRIPYSIFFDVNDIADIESPFPQMMPSNKVFIEKMKELDIRKSDEIIIYDRIPMFGAPRVWFMLYAFGHRKVRILNGGMIKYEEISQSFEFKQDTKILDRIYEIRKEKVTEEDFNYKLNEEIIYDLKKTVRNEGNFQIVDARSEERYLGKVQEPVKSKNVGHIEGAISLFFKRFLTADSKMKNKEDLQKEFEKSNVDINKKVIAYCGSGITACVIIFAMAILGKVENAILYDASWCEYGDIDKEELEKLKKE